MKKKGIPVKFGEGEENPFEAQIGLPAPLENDKSRAVPKLTSQGGFFDELKKWKKKD